MELKLIFLITIFVAVSSNNNFTRHNVTTAKSNYHSLINTSTTPQVSFCYAIKQNCNKSQIFCGITTKWIPEYSRAGCITACIIVSLFPCTAVILFIIKYLWKIINIVGYFLVLKLLWDAADVTFDVYTFYQLNIGNLVDPGIYRNIHVINGILAFAILGAISIFYNMYNIYCTILLCDIHKNRQKDKLLDKMIVLRKMGNGCISFVFEDCFELLFEYFWIEKYVTSTPAYYLFAKDVLIVFHTLIALTILIQDRMHFKPFYFMLSIPLIINICAFLRSGAVIYQYAIGKINSNCLDVIGGKLIQKPFSSGCMRNIVYTILVLNFIPIPALFFVICLPEVMNCLSHDAHDKVPDDELL